MMTKFKNRVFFNCGQTITIDGILFLSLNPLFSWVYFGEGLKHTEIGAVFHCIRWALVLLLTVENCFIELVGLLLQFVRS